MYDASNNPPIRLSYHFGNHYNSVRDPEAPSIGVGLGLPGSNAMVPIFLDDDLLVTIVILIPFTRCSIRPKKL